MSNRKTAINLAKKMHARGQSLDAIHRAVTESGYVSERTGKPLSKHSVYAIILSKKSTAKTKKPKTTQSKLTSDIPELLGKLVYNYGYIGTASILREVLKKT